MFGLREFGVPRHSTGSQEACTSTQAVIDFRNVASELVSTQSWQQTLSTPEALQSRVIKLRFGLGFRACGELKKLKIRGYIGLRFGA